MKHEGRRAGQKVWDAMLDSFGGGLDVDTREAIVRSDR